MFSVVYVYLSTGWFPWDHYPYCHWSVTDLMMIPTQLQLPSFYHTDPPPTCLNLFTWTPAYRDPSLSVQDMVKFVTRTVGMAFLLKLLLHLMLLPPEMKLREGNVLHLSVILFTLERDPTPWDHTGRIYIPLPYYLPFSGFISYLRQVHHVDMPPDHNWHCKIGHTVLFTSTFCSTFFILSMTFDRFYSIIMPHKAASFNTVKRAKFTVMCIILFSILYHIPHML